MLRIVIIGGGITGAAAAAELAREGQAVTLIDKHGIAAMASGWTLGGVRQSGRDPAELPLARAAVAMWGGLAETLGVDVEYRRTGNLRLARTPAEVDVIRELVSTQQALGLPLQFLSDNAAIRVVAPEISRSVLSASYCPTDGHANPVKATQAFAKFARSHGAAIREGVAALGITVKGDRVTGVASSEGFIPADRIVVAAGVNSRSLLSPLGADLPLSIRIVHVVQSEPLPSCLLPVFGVANADCAGRQEADGRLRFSSGAGAWPGDASEWTARSLAPSASDIHSVVNRVAQVLPMVGEAPIARSWGGLIDLTPDALPVIDAPEHPSGLVIAAGFSGHGFCLGPVSGLLCADLALGRVPRHDLSPFHAGSFRATRGDSGQPHVGRVRDASSNPARRTAHYRLQSRYLREDQPMKKIVFGIAIVSAAALMFAQPAFAQKKSLVVGMGSADAGKLDPHIASTTPDKGLLSWMFNGLVRVRPGRISPEYIEPDLAESWTSNPAGTEWTFKIRAGVQCHHGYGEFTADDAVYSLKRASNKATSSYSNDYSAVDKVEALDKSTVKITLKNPVAGFLGYVANVNGGNMICKKAAEEMGENFAKKPIGTGPFMFAEYQPQQFVKLVANKQYFRGAPQINDITYRYIPADSSRDLAFQSGELDMIYGKQDQTWVDRTSKLPGVKVVAMEPGELSELYLNVTVKPLDDIRVRQAIAYAIDRKAIVTFKGAGTSREAVSVVPSGYLGTDQKAPLFPYDLAKAKALLAEAGYPNGVTIKTIHTTLTGMQTLIEAVQAQLKKAGINLDIELVEHATFHANIRKDLSPIVHYQAGRFPVADVYLTQFFDSKSIVATPTAVTNFSHCNVADEEIRAARVATDPAKQLALWKTAQEKLIKAVCGVPIYEQLQLWAWKDTLDLGYEVQGSLNLSPPVTEKAHFTK